MALKCLARVKVHRPYGITELEDGDRVALTLNDNGRVTAIRITRDTYKDALLTAVDANFSEVNFGDIFLVDSGGGTDVHSVDDDTIIILDDEQVTLAELEDALDDFNDRCDTTAIITARTDGDVAVSGSHALWISVITKKTVVGDVSGAGNDGDYFVRVDRDKVYYDTDYLTVGLDFAIGDSVRLLLNHDDVAMLLLRAVASEAQYFGKVTGYLVDSEGLAEVSVTKADGAHATLRDFVGTFTDDPTAELDKVCEVVVDDYGRADFYARGHMTLQGSGLYSDQSSTWLEVGGTKYVLAEELFVYDADANEFITLAGVEDTDTVYVYSIDGLIGYVVIDN